MKPFQLLLLFAVFISFSAKATVRVVHGIGNGNVTIPGQFNSVFSAAGASAIGDTIYVMGSSTVTHFSFSLNKQLVIIGTGYNPDKQNPVTSRITGIDFASGSAGTKIIGMCFTSNMTSSLIGTALITFENCQFSNSTITFNSTSQTYTFNSCLFQNSSGINTFTSSNDTVYLSLNWCVFTSQLSTNSSSTWKGEISNCLFLGTGSTSFLTNGYTLNIAYNIFYGTNPQILGTNNSNTANRNISFAATNNTFNAINDLSNFVNQNPLFTTYTPPGFSFSHNYQLQAGSPGKGQGAFFTDTGIYGMNVAQLTSPFKMSGEPANIPVIRQMNLGATNVVSGTPINVNVISTVKP